MATRHILAADIGGTNSRFAVYGLDEVPGGLELYLVPGARLQLPTAAFGSFGELLASLRTVRTAAGFTLLGNELDGGHNNGLNGGANHGGFEIAAASLAVPGAVQGSGSKAFCRAPNIRWTLSAAEAESVIPAPVFMLNDFAAQGRSCLFPEVLWPQPVVSGAPQSGSPSVIIGAGTGLGKAIILPSSQPGYLTDSRPGNRLGGVSGNISGGASENAGEDTARAARRVFISTAARRSDGTLGLSERVLPSEGGHSIFPFKGAEEAAFERFLTQVTGKSEVIGDMAVTGFGLAALYAFHSGEGELLPPPQVTPLLAGQPKALEWMARFYGRACRNMVFETLALGGVYLSGGMLSHVPGLLGHPAFIEEFRGSESQPDLIGQVPVWWVSNQDNGLWGAAFYGVDRGGL